MSQPQDERTMSETDIQSSVEKSRGKKTNIVMDSQILTALMECPRKSDFRFNHNLVTIKGKSNSLECGSIVHTYLEVYYKCIIQGLDKAKAHAYGMTAAELYIKGCPYCTDFVPHLDETSPDDVMITKPQCGHKPNDYPGVKNTPAESEGYKTGWKFVLETCEQYAAHYSNDHWVPLEVEIVKSKILYEDDDIRILWKAKLDLTADTNQGIYPIDHKTMKQRRDTTNLNNQFTGQCLIQGTRNVIINKIGFQKTLPLNQRFERGVLSYSSDRLIEWQSEILPYYAYQLLAYADSGNFPPNFSSCDGKYGPCAFKEVCEADPHMREEELRNNFMVGPTWNPTNEDE